MRRRAISTTPAKQPVPLSRSQSSHLLDICPEVCLILIGRLSAVSRVSCRTGTSLARARPGFVTAQPRSHPVPLAGASAQPSVTSLSRGAQGDGAGPVAGDAETR